MPQQASDNASAAGRRADEAADCIAVMRLQEESDAYRRVDYLASLHSGDDQQIEEEPNENSRSRPQSHGFAARPVDAECRRKMSDWCLKVVDYCDFDRETVSVAMTYLDRFLSSASPSSPAGGACRPRARSCLVSRREYQLAAMTSLYLAVKLHEPLLTMDAEHVSDLSRGSYSAAEVVAMERDILAALRWRTSDPTPLGFLARFVSLLPTSCQGGGDDGEEEDGNDSDSSSAGATSTSSAEEVLLEMGRTQTELAASEYSFVALNASTVAVAALLNAAEAAGDFLLSPREAEALLGNVAEATGVDIWGDEVEEVRSRLRGLLAGSGYDSTRCASEEASTVCSSASTAEETEPETDSESESSVCSDDDTEPMSVEEQEPQPTKRASSMEASKKCTVESSKCTAQSLPTGSSCSTTQEDSGIARRLFGLGRSSLAAACSLASRFNAQSGGTEVLSLL